jgi:hypothetical protein
VDLTGATGAPNQQAVEKRAARVGESCNFSL